MNSFKWIDIFRQLPKDLTEPTFCGALGFSEIRNYIQCETHSNLVISTSHAKDTFKVNIDITFPRMPCDVIGLSFQDSLGNMISDYYGELHKHRLDYEHDEKDLGIETWKEKNVGRKNLRDRTDQELTEHQGCRFEGFIELNRVPGAFYISSESFVDVIQSLEIQGRKFDFSFRIDHLSFGDKKDFASIKNAFPSTDIQNPLDGFVQNADNQEIKIYRGDKMVTEKSPKRLSTQFFISAIPSTFSSNYAWLFDTEVFQIKASKEVNKNADQNVLVFQYQISQVTVRYSNARENLLQFLINLCAIIGGTFTVARILDSAIHKTSKIFLKQQINKLV